MIDSATLDAAIAALAEAGGDSPVSPAGRVRARCPGLMVAACDDDDVCGIDPVARLPGLDLYFVAAEDACLALSRDPEAAIGLVIARVEGE